MTPRAGRWRTVLAGAATGAVAALGQAPYDQPAVLLLALVFAVFLFHRAPDWRSAGTLGWAFGLGYFGHALHWIVSPFLVDVARHGWMAPFALFLMAAGLALFWGGAFALARRLDPGRAWALVLCLPAAEMLRGHVFTGFPWAMPAQALVGNLGGQALAWIGPYGLNIVIVGAAVILAAARQGPMMRTVQFGTVLAVLGALFLPPVLPPAATQGPVIRLIQPNAAQRDKYDPDLIPVFFRRQLDFTAAPPAPGSAAPDLILWSETAIPWDLTYADEPLALMAEAAGGRPLGVGVIRSDADGVYNSLAVLGPDGAPQQVYDKHHLVPFGEYVPFARLLNRLGIFGLAQTVPEGFAKGPGPQLLDFGPLGRALPLICYEAVFPRDVLAAPERPDFLIQVTNDAWFGQGAGPRQHLAQARMRAIEQGLPLARAANTGISAIIDPWGRVPAFLPLNTEGYLDAVLPRPLPPTLYSRTGNLPVLLLLLAGLALAAIRLARQGRRV